MKAIEPILCAASLALATIPLRSEAGTYRLKADDTLDQSNWKSSSSFAEVSGVPKGGGWVNEADAGDTADYPAAGNDYVVDGRNLRTPGASASVAFPGDSLALRSSSMATVDGMGRLSIKNTGSSTMTVADLRLEDGAITISDSYANLGLPVIAGSIAVPAGRTGILGTPSSGDTGDRRAEFAASFSGAGALAIYFAAAETQVILSGDAGGFTGPVSLDHDGAHFTGVAGGGKLVVKPSATWFGNPASPDADGFVIRKGGRVFFEGDIASTGANRGFKILNKAATIDVAEGKTVTIDGAFAGSAGFAKTGAGTLVLSGDNDGLSGTITVGAGALVAGSATAVGSATVVVAGGTFTPFDGGGEEAEPTTCTWTGASGDLEWNTAGNWDGGVVPRIADTAVFTDAGLSSGATVALAEPAFASNLVVLATFPLTLSGAESSLTLRGLSRGDAPDAAGVTLTLNVPVMLLPGDGGTNVWDVAGDEAVRVSQDLSAAGPTAVCLAKTGTGAIRLSKASSAYRGPWHVRAGAVRAEASSSIGGSITVGGGGATATLRAEANDAFAGSANLTVKADGTFDANNKTSGSSRIATLSVGEGGVVTNVPNWSAGFAVRTLNLSGGSFSGYASAVENIAAQASDAMSIVNGTVESAAYNTWRTITVGDGPCPVDLALSRVASGYGSAATDTLAKEGAGTIRTTSDCDGLVKTVAIRAGAWYVDNPSRYGLGTAKTSVNAGAKLGGTGFIGASATQQDGFTLTLANGSAASFATLSPGTVDATTGAHVRGSLTVGSESVPNGVSLGSNARLEIGLPVRGDGGAVEQDGLVVHGVLAIGSDCALDLSAHLPDGPGKALAGSFVAVHADGGVDGAFATVVSPQGRRCAVEYVETGSGTDIVVIVPGSGTMVLIR